MRRIPGNTVLLAMISALAASSPSQANTPEIVDIFQSALACRLAQPTLADMPVSSVYTLGDNGCELVAPAEDGEGLDADLLYTDANCSVSLAFEATSLSDWCDTLLDSEDLGEGEGLSTDLDRATWTLSPGSRLDLGARPLDGVTQPWVQRSVFREVDTAGGRCRLEMRVYAPRPVVNGSSVDVDDGSPVSNGRGVIAWHGGSWSSRGFGYFGLELTVPHFIERGFTVFAPFYRLLDNTDGSAACHQADFETAVVDDAFAAFDWVRDNAARYGVSGDPVLFGQSAGGHLAARVAAERPDQVASAILFYAPVDFSDFVERAQLGLYTDEQGLDIITRVVDESLDQVNLSASPIAENSLPQRVVRDGIEMPPLFMLHGDADELVESRQSMRLCQAVAGSELVATDIEVPTVTNNREVFLCGDQSTVHRVRQGQHALDVCIASTFIATDLCLSGSEASRVLVADSIGSAATFASNTALPGGDDDLLIDDEPPADGGPQDIGGTLDDGTGGSSGGGAAMWLVLLAAFTQRLRSARRVR